MRSGITARTICGECSLGGAPESKAIDYGVDGNLARVFQVEDLVSCFVQRRSRTKASDVWSAPMRVIAKLGDRNYAVCNGRRKKTVHINDIKRVSLPSGSGWKLNTTLMEECQRDWQLDLLGVERPYKTMAKALQGSWGVVGNHNLDKLEREQPEFVLALVPNLPTMSWFIEWRQCQRSGYSWRETRMTCRTKQETR